MTLKSVIESIKGTPIYISPEIWDKSEYSKSSDVYAFAIICYEVITNLKPFDGFTFFEIPIKLKKGYRPEFKKTIPESYKNLIKLCWSDDPSNRPTFEEIDERLKNDRGFITEKIDENEYLKYVNYINECEVSFDNSKTINCIDLFEKFTKKNIELSSQIIDYFSIKPSILPINDFVQLVESCQNKVKQADYDGEKLFEIGKSFFEGQDIFPRNPMFAIKYLKESMKTGFVQSAIYYCEQLINGKIIPRNIKKAKKLLETVIKDQKQDDYFLLYGKINKKEKN